MQELLAGPGFAHFQSDLGAFLPDFNGTSIGVTALEGPQVGLASYLDCCLRGLLAPS